MTPLFTPTAFGGRSGRIAYTLCSGTEFYDPEDFLGCEIHAINVDGSNPAKLTNDNIWDCCAVWSPDGTKIGFSTSFGGDIDIYVMNADGSNMIQLTDDPADDRPPVWSPDGRLIAFVSDRDGVSGPELYVMNSDGSNPILLLPSARTVSWLNKTQNPVMGNSDCTSGWTRLQTGEHARVSQDTLTPNCVRSGPSTSDKVTVLLHPGSVLKLLEGPVCANGLIFWKVENSLIPEGSGWTAEGAGKEYWLEPYTP